ncbi:EamA family transporter [Mucilaginibacter sp.]
MQAATRKPYTYIAAAIAAPLIWGFFSIPLRQLHHYASQQIMCYRVFVSLLLVWVINLGFRSKVVKHNIDIFRQLQQEERSRIVWRILGSGLFITANWFSYIYVVNHVSLQTAAFAYLICPLLTACGGFFILKESITRLKLIGVGIALVSVAMLSAGSLSQGMWALWVGAMYAAYLIIQRTIPYFDRLFLLGIQLVIATLLLLPVYFYNFQPVPAAPAFWINIGLIATVFTIFPLMLSLYALTGVPSSTLGISMYVNPVAAFAVAFIYFNEKFDINQLAGYLLLLVAVLIFNSEYLPFPALKRYAVKTV